MLNRWGVPFEYELHSFAWEELLTTATCKTCGTKTCYKSRVYTPDFFIGDPNKPLIIETKGLFTAHDRKIALAMKEQHPNENLRYLFLRDNKLSRKSKTRYTAWCKSKGLHGTVGTDVLKSWVDELA